MNNYNHAWPWYRKNPNEFKFFGHVENMLLVSPPKDWMTTHEHSNRYEMHDGGYGISQKTLTAKALQLLAEHNGRLCEGIVPGSDVFWFDFETEHDAIKFKLTHS